VREKLVSALAGEEIALDLVCEDATTPPVPDGLIGVPEPPLRLLDRLEKPDIVPPRQLGNTPLHNFGIWPGFGEGPHVFEVARREPLHAGKGGAEIGGEPVDDLRAPAGGGLAVEDLPANLPVQAREFPVEAQRCPEPRPPDRLLQLREQDGVALRHRVGFRTHRVSHLLLGAGSVPTLYGWHLRAFLRGVPDASACEVHPVASQGVPA